MECYAKKRLVMVRRVSVKGVCPLPTAGMCSLFQHLYHVVCLWEVHFTPAYLRRMYRTVYLVHAVESKVPTRDSTPTLYHRPHSHTCRVS